ncbi:hypothetical protein MSG28_014926, partial [Choristoneura fumiferana]
MSGKRIASHNSIISKLKERCEDPRTIRSIVCNHRSEVIEAFKASFLLKDEETDLLDEYWDTLGEQIIGDYITLFMISKPDNSPWSR